MRVCVSTSTRARPNNTGTTVSKVLAGRCSSSQEPVTAPSSEAGMSCSTRRRCPASSRRYPQVPEKLPGTRPITLLIVAVTGGMPKDIRTGNVNKVPEPTMALIAPAATPDSAIAAISRAVIVSACPVPQAPRLPAQLSAPHSKPSGVTYRSCILSSYRCLTAQAVFYLRRWTLSLKHTL